MSLRPLRPLRHFMTYLEIRRKFLPTTPESHLQTMRLFVRDFSGICNFNYKVRPAHAGRLAIFEINARVGGDLAVDVPRGRAAALLEQLDRMGDAASAEQPAWPWARAPSDACTVPRAPGEEGRSAPGRDSHIVNMI